MKGLLTLVLDALLGPVPKSPASPRLAIPDMSSGGRIPSGAIVSGRVFAISEGSPLPTGAPPADRSAASPGKVTLRSNRHDVGFPTHLRTVADLERSQNRVHELEHLIADLEAAVLAWAREHVHATDLHDLLRAVGIPVERLRMAPPPMVRDDDVDEEPGS